ncbi:hypothetical protein L6452_26346 [Arctium lappa]|uniref:Uncharacterized protein n=1 Tax=Arctium lappa TaxID=4217 RepID=A0ACB9AC43_ARCLA|nr:hypothetical protein L6452_26346 [Arctium lappa]
MQMTSLLYVAKSNHLLKGQNRKPVFPYFQLPGFMNYFETVYLVAPIRCSVSGNAHEYPTPVAVSGT